MNVNEVTILGRGEGRTDQEVHPFDIRAPDLANKDEKIFSSPNWKIKKSAFKTPNRISNSESKRDHVIVFTPKSA